MAVKKPTINIAISGDGITTLNESRSFDLENKAEVTYDIGAGLTIDLDYSNIDNINALIVSGSADFGIILSKDGGTNIIEIGVTNQFPVILPVKDSFMDSLDSIQIINNGSESIDVSVRIYGEQVSV